MSSLRKQGPITTSPSIFERTRSIASATIIAGGYGSRLALAWPGRRSQMREIMCERSDFLFAQGIGDLRHRRHAATGSQARLVVAQRLEQVILALASDAGDRLRSRIGIGVA